MWFHLEDVGPDTPRLPEHRLGALGQIAASAVVHAAAALTIALAVTNAMTPAPRVAPPRVREPLRIDMQHMVFLAPDPRPGGSGGGGGGNREAAPIRRAQGVGSDPITLRVRKAPPARAPDTPPAHEDVPTLPSVVLDVKPLASGAIEQIGLPMGGVLESSSTGPGAGGGVGTGNGSGIGPGNGPGFGPGSGGGTGGGVFRPGSGVSAPRVITEVRPKYTNDALFHKVQGTVVLELIVTREGRASQVHVVRSLDPHGLDQEAVAAVMQWRFEPGRLAGAPVDVLVTAMLDFRIQ